VFLIAVYILQTARRILQILSRGVFEFILVAHLHIKFWYSFSFGVRIFCCCFGACSVVIVIPHVWSFRTLVGCTLTASNVSTFHPNLAYVLFYYRTYFLVTARKGARSRHEKHSHRHKLFPLRRDPMLYFSVLEVITFQYASLRKGYLLALLPMLAQCPVHPNLLGFTVQTILDNLYKPRRSWLSNVVNRPVGILLLLNIAALLCFTCSCAWYCSAL
jgi:hypothetical protein